MQAIILAGGRARALAPLTARQPRSLLPLANKPLIRYQIELLQRHGISDIIVCVDHLAEKFERYFSDPNHAPVTIHVHRDAAPRGTAGALKAAESIISDGTLLVLNGHILTDVDIAALVAYHEEKQARATVYLSPNPDPLHYGVALTDADGRIRRFVEKPGLIDEAPTDTINAGIYVLERSVLDRIPVEAEYSLERDLFPALLSAGAPFYGFVSEAYWQDISTLTGYRKAHEDILAGRLEVEMAGHKEGEHLWMGAGADVHPTAELSGAIVVGKGAVIGKNAKVHGYVSIGANCRVEAGATIDNSILWRGTVVEEGAVVKSCILGDDCTVRQGAAVQHGSVLGEGSVVASYLASLDSAEEAARRAKIKFGTDGWRGIIADDFTGDNVRLVTQAVVDYFHEPGVNGEPIVVIGYDHRSQSEYFAAEAAKVVAASGFEPVLSSGPCSSPALAYMVKFLQAKGGLMVTASHNPPQFNGLKVKAHYGGSASPAIVAHIERHLQRLIAEGSTPDAIGVGAPVVQMRDFREAFFAHLSSLVDLKRIAAANFNIVVDPMHGSGAGYLSTLLRDAGVKRVTEIRSERNPVFGGINPEPIRENLGALFDAVKAGKADVGIALDGDADRLGAVDSAGRFVDCHRIFCVLLRHLVEERGWTGGVVKTVSTTQMVDKLAAKYGLKVYETPIGFKHICDLMLTEDVLIGGEESGGIGVKNHIPERDGVLMGLLLLEAMAASGKKLSQMIEEIMRDVGRHEFGRIDLHPEPHRMHTIISSLQSLYPYEMEGLPVAEVSRKDGTKVIFEDGSWLLLRPSGTEPVVRVYAEAPTEKLVKNLLSAGVALVQGAK